MESIASSTNGQITSWADLNLNEVVTEREEGTTQTRSELPAGNYKFKLVGAKQNPFESGTTDIDLVVVEGPNAKRHLFAKLPAPNVTKYAAQWAAILVKRLGGSQLPGEDLITLLNRIAPTASPITADVVEDSYFSTKQNQMVSKPKLQYFSIAAA
jgi:hypothetical protein